MKQLFVISLLIVALLFLVMATTGCYSTGSYPYGGSTSTVYGPGSLMYNNQPAPGSTPAAVIQTRPNTGYQGIPAIWGSGSPFGY